MYNSARLDSPVSSSSEDGHQTLNILQQLSNGLLRVLNLKNQDREGTKISNQCQYKF